MGIWNTGTTNNTISNNYIGTNADGTAALGGQWFGVGCWSNAQQSTIQGNIIGSNESDRIHFNGCSKNTILANYVGTNTNGTNLGNIGNGINIFNGSRENVVGPGNVIAYNKYSGISVSGPATISNKITRNSIYSSGGSGIGRGNGGNTQIQPPVITSATATVVSGTAPPNAIIEIFSDDVDEGRVYEGTTNADSAGNFTFSKSAGFSRAYLTATATDATGNTTEFSAPKAKS